MPLYGGQKNCPKSGFEYNPMNTRCKKNFRSIGLLVLEHPTFELCIFLDGFESDHNAAPQLFQILNLQLSQGVRIVSMHVVQYT